MKHLLFVILIVFSLNIFSQNKIETNLNSHFFSEDNNLNLENLHTHTQVKEDTIYFLDSPVDKSHISSGYGKRFHPILKINKIHNGIDFAAPYGSEIKATAGGIIENEGYNKFNGNFVVIKHTKVYSTQYLHLSEIKVIKGLKIKKGDVIGLVGSSGQSTGPHVCYRFWKNGKQINPSSIKKIVDKPDIKDYNNENQFKSFINDFF